MIRTTHAKVILIAISMVLAAEGPAQAFSGGGSGTELDPYVITNVDQLQEMQDDLNGYYVLGNDIDATDTQTWNSGAGFQPVGQNVEGYKFTGSLDGRGYSIENLHIDRIDSWEQGLFGMLSGAVIQNVNMINGYVRCYRGGILAYAAYDGSMVINCSSTGTVTLKPGSSDAK